MYYGVQYYPEQWPEERWPIDADMMQRAGVNTVRMGEFAWSAYEPREGEIDFSWMDRAIRLLNEHGIQVILCTCSRTPPPWVFAHYPGVANVRADGHTNLYGQRYTIGLAHPEFIALAEHIDRAVIEHFAGHPGIVGWQIDNEVGGFNDCFCPHCLERFQDYLRHTYQTVENLNQRWGANFWSLAFGDFDEVPLPANNPQLALEYRRFLSSLNVDFYRSRAAMIRQGDPGKFVTSNFQSFQAKHTDYFQAVPYLDLPGMNHYPPRSPEFILDYYRGEKNALIVLEQFTRLVDVDSGNGWMRLWAYRALGHGACGTIFFRWRTARFGLEQHRDGILPHAGQENRRYRELAQMGTELQQIGAQIDATKVISQAAILMGYDGRWALEAGLGEKTPMRGELDAVRLHKVFLRRNIMVDAFDPHGELLRYRLMIAPRLWLVDPAIAANLRGFVEQGGTLLLTAASGVTDEYNQSFDTPRPGPLADVCGIEVSDLSPLDAPLQIACASIPGLDGAAARDMADEIHPTTGDVLAVYTQGWRKGLPVLTRNRFGQGQAYYLGSVIEGDGLAALVDALCAEAGIQPGPATPENVFVYTRTGADRRLFFYLNQNEEAVTVTLPPGCRDLFTGEACRQAEIGAVDVRIFAC